MRRLPSGKSGSGPKIQPEPPRLPPSQPTISKQPFKLPILLIPGILMLVLMVGFFILAYGIGLDQGKRAANDEREAFYQERIARLGGVGAISPEANGTPGSRSPGGAGQTFARVDKIEGDKVTVILLGPGGTPTGVNLVITLNKAAQVYKTSEAQPGELRPGDNILITGDKTGDNFVARNVVVLPPAG